MEELKPCPFCGEEVYSEAYSQRKDCEYDIHCTNKKCLLGYMDLLFISGEKWNSRPIEDTLTATIAQKDAEIERLREAIQDSIKYLKEYSHLPVSGYALLGELIQILKTEVNND